MLIPEEYIEVLVELGLTHTEAKVYMALLCLKSAEASVLHRESNVARQEVYRILSDLQEKGLIEKIIGRPTRFTPISANDTIRILLERRRKQNRELRRKAIKRFRNFEIDCTGMLTFDRDAKFVLLSKSEANPTGHIDKLGEAIDNAQKSVMCSITFPFFIKVKYNDENKWKKAVKRAVKFKFIISRSPNEKSELSLDTKLKNSDYFEIRWTSSPLPASVLLVDEREAFCRIGYDVECPVLWSANPNFVSMIKEYFEMKWKTLEHNKKLENLVTS
jgi:sugar-specific transcriptional regulator TrmB